MAGPGLQDEMIACASALPAVTRRSIKAKFLRFLSRSPSSRMASLKAGALRPAHECGPFGLGPAPIRDPGSQPMHAPVALHDAQAAPRDPASRIGGIEGCQLQSWRLRPAAS
jgi:hypothetical protein